MKFVAIVKLDDGSRHEAGQKESKLGDRNSFNVGGWHGGRTDPFALSAI